MKRLFTLCVAALTLSGAALAQEVGTATTPLALKTVSTDVIPANALRGYSSYEWSKVSNTNYEAVDIDGNKYNIGNLLAEGKKVMIDFSATWCGPCWKMHESGLLEKAYSAFGPNGEQRQDLIVLWIEATGADKSEIQKKGKDWTKVHGTDQKVPYPIISDANIISAMGFEVRGYPTVALLLPSGEYIDLYQRFVMNLMNINLDELGSILAEAPTPKDPPTAVTPKALETAFSGEPIKWTPLFNSIGDAKGYQWEFEGADITSSTDKNPVVTWANPGTYKVKLTVTNNNGSASGEIQYQILDGSTTKFPLVAHFEENVLDKGWRTFDQNEDGRTWATLGSELERLKLKPSVDLGYNSKNPAVSWSFYPTSASPGAGGGVSFSGLNATPDDWLVSPVINIPADAAKPTLFFATNGFLSGTIDSYKLLVSTKTINPIDFETVLKEDKVNVDGSWVPVTIDLSAYKGQKIYLAFVHQAKDAGCGALLDEIHVSLEGSVGLNAPVAENVAVYPVPAKDELFVEAAEGSSVVLFDLVGRQLKSVVTDVATYRVDVQNLPDGNYFVRVVEPSGATKIVPVTVKH